MKMYRVAILLVIFAVVPVLGQFVFPPFPIPQQFTGQNPGTGTGFNPFIQLPQIQPPVVQPPVIQPPVVPAPPTNPPTQPTTQTPTTTTPSTPCTMDSNCTSLETCVQGYSCDNMICVKEPCRKGWTLMGANCLFYGDDEIPWMDAVTACELNGGSLLILDAAKFASIVTANNLDDSTFYWTALNNIVVDGCTAVGFTEMPSSVLTIPMPNNAAKDCVSIKGDGNTLERRRCGDSNKYICEAPTN